MTTHHDRVVVLRGKRKNAAGMWRTALSVVIYFAVGLCSISNMGAESISAAEVWMRHPAEQDGRAKSVHSDVKTAITFINSADETLKVYWLNFTGERVLYKTLPKKERVYQLTYLTHPWLVTDENDNALYLFYPDAQPRIIEVMKP